MQFYTDPTRETDEHALPDAEVFYVEEPYVWNGRLNSEHINADGNPLSEGYYWWPCFPGCLPDGDPVGPFETEEEAIQDARGE